MKHAKIKTIIEDLAEKITASIKSPIELPIDLKTLSDETGIKMPTLYGWQRKDIFKWYKLGGKVMVYRSEFNEAVKSMKETSKASN